MIQTITLSTMIFLLSIGCLAIVKLTDAGKATIALCYLAQAVAICRAFHTPESAVFMLGMVAIELVILYNILPNTEENKLSRIKGFLLKSV